MSLNNSKQISESESAEEESDIVSFVVSFGVGQISVGFGEFLPDFIPGSLSVLGGLEGLVLEVLQVEIINHESGRDDMILVNVLDEGLDTSSLEEFLFIDSSLDAARVTSDASN